MVDDPERDPVQEELPRPTLGELMERTPARLLVESAVGAGGGAILSGVFPLGTEMGTLGFALSGALAAPVALLLTPLAGSLAYRAVRYGLGLALPIVLVVSFVGGTEQILVEDLLILGTILFGIGAVGHGAMGRVLDGADSGAGPESPPL
jgi:hypothetical protein